MKVWRGFPWSTALLYENSMGTAEFPPLHVAAATTWVDFVPYVELVVQGHVASS